MESKNENSTVVLSPKGISEQIISASFVYILKERMKENNEPFHTSTVMKMRDIDLFFISLSILFTSLQIQPKTF